MNKNLSFWLGLAVFQVIFGLAIFGLTRNYYLDREQSTVVPATSTHPPTAASTADRGGNELENLINTVPGPFMSDDPAEINQRADELFVRKQYVQAAELYRKLLDMGHSEVNIYNNLGITLHYLARSEEALAVLNEGVAVDPSYQRIWLTLGFVNGQAGRVAQAREALSRAVEMDAGSEVGQTAAEMLAALGAGG